MVPTTFKARLDYLAELDISAQRNAFKARYFSLNNGRFKPTLNHRVDVCLYNRFKFWWMPKLKFEV